MIRKVKVGKAPASDREGFRLRGTQVSRIEGISDAVFGLAFTLIVVSLKAPVTFRELTLTLQGFVASGACVMVLVQVWNRHYLYFRRYALEDGPTRLLNTLLLFLVIAYVYPLKFLFGAFFDTVFGFRATGMELSTAELPQLFIIYGTGFALVYATFGVMYRHALKRSAHLELTVLEILQTRWIMWEHWFLASVGVISILLAAFLTGNAKVYAGFAYFLIPVFLTIHGMKHGDAVRKYKAAIEASDAIEPTQTSTGV